MAEFISFSFWGAVTNSSVKATKDTNNEMA
jgi:hypothetical protein